MHFLIGVLTSPKVREDILEIFKIPDENVITAKTLNRSEISLEVINTKEASKDKLLFEALERKLPDSLKKKNINDIHKEGSGIIFTIYAAPKGRTTRPLGTEHVKENVDLMGIHANIYHSQLEDKYREETQRAYTENEFPLLVATKGFGMGIDKPNIRYIVHMCYPNSLEAYYQEAGRAGRDRQHAHSLILSKSRTKQCVNDLKDLEIYEPRCANSWVCYYTRNGKCDYGMQARFISSNYPSEKVMKASILSCYEQIKENYNDDNWVIIEFDNKISKEYQSYLFHFQREKIIKDYLVLSYKRGKMEFEIRLAKEFFDKTIVEEKVNKIVRQLQTFKRQKYNMLESIWEYVNNKTTCRRQFLMDYFQDSVRFGAEGCKFCDIEGISDEIAMETTKSTRIAGMYDLYHSMVESGKFNYKTLKELLDKMYVENEQESFKIRAMRHLEDYTDNQVALYIRCMISLKREPSDAYSWNQSLELLKNLLSSTEKKELPHVVNDLSEIDSQATQGLLLNIEDRLFDGVASQAIWELAEDQKIRAIAKQKYAIHSVSRLNAKLERWAANGNSRIG
ncbi:MAG TPA: hypothetical protein DHN33_04120 [Eubacteriaceae bacterium]|nr:hypothetical protein [Eubacteriaceae bacterium]